MKKIFILFVAIMAINQFAAQVAIGKTNIDGAGILDFALNDTKGIVLPYTTAVTSPINGTLTYDATTKKVKHFINNNWVDMTGAALVSPTVNTDPEIGNGVIIGSNTSLATGVLVLESNAKALILPKVNDPSTDIFNPAPGTICYDLTNKALAIFNGDVWAYWK